MVVSDHVYLRLMTALISLYHLRHQWDAQPGPSLTSCRVCAHQRWASYTTIVSSTPSSPLHHHHLLYTTIISCTPPSSPLHHHHLLYTTIVSINSSTSQSSLVEPRTTPAGLQATEPASAPPRTGHTHEDRTCTSTCVLAFCRRPIRDSAEAGSAAWGRVFTRNSR